MAKFRVWAKSISYCYVDVEAKDELQAKERADELDGGDFNDDCFGDWEFGDVQELPEDAEVYYDEDYWEEVDEYYAEN